MRKKKSSELENNHLDDLFDEEYARERRRKRRKNLNKRKYHLNTEDNEGMSYRRRNWTREIEGYDEEDESE